MGGIDMGSLYRASACFILAAFFLFSGRATAHEHEHTHNYLARASVWLLGNPIVDAHAEELIAQGVIDEDTCPNYYSHFINARTGELMRNEIVPPPPPVLGIGGDPYCADDVNPRDNQTTATVRGGLLWDQAVAAFRAGNRDGAFKLLGQTLHLLQDMTSPAHVHNAPHGIAFRDNCGQDFDDFETWGWCDDNVTHHIEDYWNLANRLPTERFARSLDVLYSRTPQFACAASDPDACLKAGEPNLGYSYVRRVAQLVYDFTTFPAVLVDFNFDADPQPDSELRRMFPSLRDATGGWSIDDEAGQQNIGFSDGNCGVTEMTWPGTREEWWPMQNPGGGENGPDCFIQEDAASNNNRTSGAVFLENIGGGGTNADLAVPDNVIPHVYQRITGGRELYRDLYGTDDNLAAESGAPDPPGKRKSMLRIYGDILYAVAAAYGAGLIQAFVDEVMPPVVRVEASPDRLWPPNHKMIPVSLAAQTDPPSPQALNCVLNSISSDEGPGRAHQPDWRITGAMTAELRAERDGGGDGRSYSLQLECTYGSGKDTLVTMVVPVAHDQSGKHDGTDGGDDDSTGARAGDPTVYSASSGTVPNPLYAAGKIWFTIDRAEAVTVSVYDFRGRLVRRVVEGRLFTAGRHEVQIDGTDARGNRLPSGVYFFRIETKGGASTGRFMTLR
jgi:flagellar hook capping protein FlgD